MSDTFGVDPKALKSVRDLADLIRIINPYEGRFIKKFPSNWDELLRESMSALSDLEQSKFIELWIAKAKSSLLPTPQAFNSSESWVKNADRIRSTTRALIGEDKDVPRVIPIGEALLDPSVFPDARSKYIERTVQDYVQTAMPLFLISNRIVLIDPYFRLSDLDRSSRKRNSYRHQRSLEGLLKACVASHKVEVFCLVVDEELALRAYSENNREACFEEELSQIQLTAKADEIQLEYRYLDPGSFTDQHPRYLLGNSAGLHFDWGFDIGKTGQRNFVTWLSESALIPLLDRYF